MAFEVWGEGKLPADHGDPLPAKQPVNRKEFPLATGVLDYFPDALMAVAHVSFTGNKQHNPGQPLHWDNTKSTDHGDTMLRHWKDRGTFDDDGEPHSAKAAWRALANLQIEIEEWVKQTGRSPLEYFGPSGTSTAFPKDCPF